MNLQLRAITPIYHFICSAVDALPLIWPEVLEEILTVRDLANNTDN